LDLVQRLAKKLDPVVDNGFDACMDQTHTTVEEVQLNPPHDSHGRAINLRRARRIAELHASVADQLELLKKVGGRRLIDAIDTRVVARAAQDLLCSLQDLLDSERVTIAIPLLGEVFKSERHTIVGQLEVPQSQYGTLVHVVTPCYLAFNGEIILKARVVVSVTTHSGGAR
jgi:hypothetical protein